MRVTGGEFCGRILAVPGSGAIRPTQDRVRAALFNILAPESAGAEFLDLFAGSGAVGIEALSRGAERAVFVERDRRNLAVLKGNLEAPGETEVRLLNKEELTRTDSLVATIRGLNLAELEDFQDVFVENMSFPEEA